MKSRDDCELSTINAPVFRHVANFRKEPHEPGGFEVHQSVSCGTTRTLGSQSLVKPSGHSAKDHIAWGSFGLLGVSGQLKSMVLLKFTTIASASVNSTFSQPFSLMAAEIAQYFSKVECFQVSSSHSNCEPSCVPRHHSLKS